MFELHILYRTKVDGPHFSKCEGQFSVESDGSEKLEADIPAGCIDSLFIRLPQSGMAEERKFSRISDSQEFSFSPPIPDALFGKSPSPVPATYPSFGIVVPSGTRFDCGMATLIRHPPAGPLGPLFGCAVNFDFFRISAPPPPIFFGDRFQFVGIKCNGMFWMAFGKSYEPTGKASSA